MQTNSSSTPSAPTPTHTPITMQPMWPAPEPGLHTARPTHGGSSSARAAFAKAVSTPLVSRARKSDPVPKGATRKRKASAIRKKEADESDAQGAEEESRIYGKLVVTKKRKKDAESKEAAKEEGKTKRKKKPAESTLEKTKRKSALKKPAQIAKQIASCPRTLVGIDLSLRNPGLCMIIPQTRTVRLFGLRNRKRETDGSSSQASEPSALTGWRFETTVIEVDGLRPDESGEARERDVAGNEHFLYRFDLYARLLIKLLAPLREAIARGERLVAGIEHYSYMSQQTQATSVLMELGTLCRRELQDMGIPMLEMSPGQIKKVFSGDGRSNKGAMLAAWEARWHLPNLFAMLNIDRPELRADGVQGVPHPIEDLVDAFAIVTSLAAWVDLDLPHTA